MLQILLTLLHVVVSVVLILVVLLQTGKRADLAGAFGGGGSQTAFGARGAATLLSKATTASAVLFMVTSLSLSILTANRGDAGGTVLDQVLVSPASKPSSKSTIDPGMAMRDQPKWPSGSASRSAPTPPRWRGQCSPRACARPLPPSPSA